MGLIKYGKIVKKHGLSGEVKVFPFSGELYSFDKLSALFLSLKDSNPKKFLIERKRYHKNLVIVKLKGIDTPEEAEKLCGYAILIDSNELPDTEDDEYYWFQLIGLKVTTEDNEFIGTVSSLLDTSAQPILVVKNNSREFMIPMVDKFVKEIDLENSKIVIDPIEGLID